MSDNGSRDPLEETVFRRGELLIAIDDQSRAKPALTEAIDASRSTVDRGAAELVEAGCIERHGSEYSPTRLGTLCADHYRRYRSNLDALEEATEVVSLLPPSASLSTTFVDGADIHSANPAAPEAALQPSIDLLSDANRLLGLAPVEISLYVDLIYENAIANGLSAEVIVERNTLEHLLEKDEERLRELVSAGRLELLMTPETLRCALWIMESSGEDVAGATVYVNGGIRGLIVNSSTEAVEWARAEYRRHRELAERKPIDEFLGD
ncbi:winged helix-turn-helix domain-containing protein [Halococcus sp. IIIV-5B]|uniref:helix-turn-helix transcriptional regulator n=1 Tax=Halococcus sp. IIIV-5B TaxID=2321230 RepID=UPI000E71A507|nr:MarR family transcriptional regulator [Halococcus sp. IIIV-5B]RJS97639.1 MarR family transcriptional regulator [Halococcus sp. IIIV-5B]